MLSETIKVLAPESEVADLFADHQKALPGHYGELPIVRRGV